MVFQLLRRKNYIATMALLCAMALIYIGMSVYSIRRNMQSYLNEARIKSGAQAHLLAENIAGAINGVDMILLSTRSIFVSYQSDNGLTLSNQMVRYIEQELKFLPQIRDLVFLNSGGDVVYSSAGSKGFDLASFEEYRDAWLDFSVEAVTAESCLLYTSDAADE